MRKEGRRDKMQLLQSIKENALKSAHDREQDAQTTLAGESDKLDEQLKNLNIPLKSLAEDHPKPCDSLRAAVAECYKRQGPENALFCTSEVEAFTECAKHLCSVSLK